MKLNNRLSLERHAFAPELSRVRVHAGPAPVSPVIATLPARGARTLKAARDSLGWRPVKPGVFVTITATRTGKYLQRERKFGYVERRADILPMLAYMRQRYAGGILLNGDILPAADISVSICLIG